MEVYVARQPIFDKGMGIVGYELLYRRSMNNFFEGVDDNQATADLINSAFLVMQFNELTSGTRAFINFSADMLIKEIPLLLPKGFIVIEILEKVEATEEVLNACRKLKSEGYMIALDDFTFRESNIPLMEWADIIKVEFSTVDIQTQRKYIQKYGDRIKFLAEKVETREEYQLAASMGYDYFQGYFFSMPVIEKSKEIASMPAALLRLIQEINQPDPDYQPLTEIIETDVGLSYKLLKFAGSVFFGTRGDVFTVKQALIRLGMNEIRKWVYLLMLKNMQSTENKELVKTCLIRAKFMELLALEAGGGRKHYSYFLAGLFSSIDVLLECDMDTAVKELPIALDVKEALLGSKNDIEYALRMVLYQEMGKWDEIDISTFAPGMVRGRMTSLYIMSLQWAFGLDL
jgi:EAL and modified HD-GYP domain-containing signal transduction protein